jgi:hypothetical protein
MRMLAMTVRVGVHAKVLHVGARSAGRRPQLNQPHTHYEVEKTYRYFNKIATRGREGWGIGGI